MKKSILALVSVIILLVACGDKKKTSSAESSSSAENTGLTVNEDEGKTGSFSADGTDFKGKSSTQYFGDKVTGQFSVLCQQDEPLALLQAVFANEKEATGTFKPIESFMSIPAGEAHVTLSGDKQFVTKSNSTGSIAIQGKKMIIKDLKLFNSDNKEKVVTANIEF